MRISGRLPLAKAGPATVELAKPLRSICLTIRELNDALLWFTIEGAP